MLATEPAPPQAGCDTSAVNSLLRGEISAIETYEQAASKFNGEPLVADLARIRDEHFAAVGVLREQVTRFGGEPSDGSGPWGVFASAVTGSAKVLGPATVLAALKQGEEHGLAEYKSALENAGIHADCKATIRANLMPACEKHVSELNRLMGGLEAK